MQNADWCLFNLPACFLQLFGFQFLINNSLHFKFLFIFRLWFSLLFMFWLSNRLNVI
jgi:hypothetical protein